MKPFVINLFIIISLTFFMMSCQTEFDYSDDEALIEEIQSATDKKTIEVTDLSSEISSEISECYFETYVDEVAKAPNKGYEIKLGTGEYVYFDMNNYMLQSRVRHTECGEIERPELGEGEQNMHQNRHQHHNGDGNNPSHGDTISIDELPDAVISYIEENYPENEILRAKMTIDAYIVKLDEPTVLRFDLDGNFIEEMPFMHHHCQGTQIAIEDLLVPITDYISENYPNAEIRQAFQLLERIEVRLIEGEQRILLVFDLEGNFLFERVCN